MMIWNQIFVLLPLAIIGTTIITIICSIAYNRNQLRHALVTIIGLSLSGIASLNVIWFHGGNQNFTSLIYIDSFSSFYTTLVIVASFATSVSAYAWLSKYLNQYGDEFYILLLISSMGGILLASTKHLAMLFLGIELVSIPLFALINYSSYRKSSISASIKYIILSGVSSSFVLFGIALIYAKTGCLFFDDIKEMLLNQNYIDVINNSKSVLLMVIIGVAMIIVGFGFKLSFVPFHLWIPDIYQGAPPAVSMYLSTSSKIAAISALIRFLSILPDYYNKIICVFLSVSACCSMLFGSLVAIYQNNIKRIFAYSSVTHIGYILVALIVLYIHYPINYFIAQEAIGIYLISYLFSNIGAFGIINIMSISSLEKETATISIYRGLFWKEPILSMIFTIVILSLAGIPMTLGFIGKFYLLWIGIDNQLWWITMFIVLSSIISMIYYLKIMINLYLYPIDNFGFNDNYFKNWMYTPEGIMSIVIAIIIMVFGLYPQPIVNLMHVICLK